MCVTLDISSARTFSFIDTLSNLPVDTQQAHATILIRLRISPEKPVLYQQSVAVGATGLKVQVSRGKGREKERKRERGGEQLAG